MDLRAIREGLAERLATVPGVRVEAFPPDQVNPGNAALLVVAMGETYVDYHQAFAQGLAIVNVILSPYLPMVSPRSAFASLDELLSSGTGQTRSLIDALMGTDRTLGGVCSDLVVDEASNVQALNVADGARYLTCDIAVRILVGRT
jgi:hypothetical protein